MEKKINHIAKHKPLSKVWIIVGVLVIAGIAAYFIFSSGGKKEEVSFETTTVGKGSIRNSVTATGSIEAVQTVTVGTQVSGIIDKLYVDYNSVVKKGQVIAELDKTNLLSTLNSAKAGLQSSKAEVQRAKANLQSAQASVSYQKSNFNRYATLYKKGLVSANDYESARLSYQQAVETASASAEQVATAEESVRQSQEQVNQANTNLGYATITSPIDGVVISKSVEEGQTVAASFSTPELFTIAKDLTKMQVVADVDEADIGDVKEGNRVTFTVDAYPDDVFEGSVTQVRQEATTTNNVVTYEVVISADNQDLKLKPGLTANVTIFTKEMSGVLNVPSKALRFTPTKETVGNRKIVDVNAKNKVWVEEGNTLKAYAVNIGTSDGTNTEILSGIKEGQKVITAVKVKETGTDTESTDDSDSNESSPFAPGPKNDKNKKKS